MSKELVIPIRDARPGMFYDGMLITLVEFTPTCCILHTSGCEYRYSINSWIQVMVYDDKEER